MRKTKIICTLGPATVKQEIIEQLIQKGMDVARFNFSHGTHETHLAMYQTFVRAREALGRPIPAMLDTKGPEIRTGEVPAPVTLVEDALFTLMQEDIIGDEKGVSISYKSLANEVRVGSHILIDDGLIEMIVEQIQEGDLLCRIVNGGLLGSHKGVNIPGVCLKFPYISEKDRADLIFAVKHGFDFISASFVRSARDVHEVRKILKSHGGAHVRIIAKIENQQGIDRIDEIIEASDAIMVARGDLGVEIPAMTVPIVQKMLIDKCYKAGKPAITATQMLDSMIRNPRPTRAEASDVANAVFDFTSCVMLSGETASGKYPLHSLETMVDIINTAENAIDYWNAFSHSTLKQRGDVTDGISHACCTIASDLCARAIITVTQSGQTARLLSRFRPACPIIAVTTDECVQRQLNLSWGVVSAIAQEVHSTDMLFHIGVEAALGIGQVNTGDTVVITAGVPVGRSGTTNLVKVETVT